MPICPNALPRLFRRGACLAIFSAAAIGAAGSALAAPDSVADPVMSLLIDRGEVVDAPAAAALTVPAAPAATPVLQRVRDRAADIVVDALNFVGVRYSRGGESAASGFDCSGFTRYVFNNSVGLVLPRRADEQARAPGLVDVRREDLQPGDLVFFKTLKRTFSHVGIYIGDNRFIHAPRPGAEVRTEDMGFAYWKKRFTGARRAESMIAASATTAGAAEPATTSLR